MGGGGGEANVGVVARFHLVGVSSGRQEGGRLVDIGQRIIKYGCSHAKLTVITLAFSCRRINFPRDVAPIAARR